jgi:hypothetical protein
MRRSTSDTRTPPPTMTYPACGGTGLNRARAFAYMTSRASVGSDPIRTAEHVVCVACEGRGRQTIARVMLDRST